MAVKNENRLRFDNVITVSANRGASTNFMERSVFQWHQERSRGPFPTTVSTRLGTLVDQVSAFP